MNRGEELITDEDAVEEFKVKEPLLLISIGDSVNRRGIYDAVRYAWRVNRNRAERYGLVLARVRGVVVGAFRPTVWLPATEENFHDLVERYNLGYAPERHGFVGVEAEHEVRGYYVGKCVPSRYRRKGIQSPVLYCNPEDT